MSYVPIGHTDDGAYSSLMSFRIARYLTPKDNM
jgi:hypothetical protein